MRRDKRYELSNHLGNVLEVVTDRKLSSSTYYYGYNFNTGLDGWAACTQAIASQADGQLQVSSYGASNCTYILQTTVVGESYTVMIRSNKGTAPGLRLALFGIGTTNLIDGENTWITFTATSTSTGLIIEPTSTAASYVYYVDAVEIYQNSRYVADVVSYSDYYPYGMQMPGRNVSSGEYRYGFNGMEADDEVKGQRNSYTTQFRQYDPRVGRWLSLDPLMAKYSGISPYTAFNNNPAFYRDPRGLEGENPESGKTEINVLLIQKSNKNRRGKVDKAVVNTKKRAHEIEDNNFNYGFGNSTDFYVLEVEDINDAAKQMESLKDKLDAKIGTLYIVSHGSRKTNSFSIGSDRITNDNIGTRDNTVLSPISDELVEGESKVVMLGCHTGSNEPGTSGNSGRGDVFVQKLANRFKAEVYANKSWTPSVGLFGDEEAYSISNMSDPDKSETYRSCPGCYEQIGSWSHASPTPMGSSAILTEEINPIILHSDGSFSVSSRDVNEALKPYIGKIKSKSLTP